MATLLSLEFYGDTQLQRTLADRVERAEDARPVWDHLADRFARLERRQFASEGAYGSGGWDPLSPRYAAWKATAYPGQTILRRDDHLFRSLTQRPLGVEVIEPHLMVLGSDVAYGAFHQAGGDRLPQRRPVELPEAERQAWVRQLQRFLVTGEAGAW